MSHTKTISCESEIKVTGYCTHCPSEYLAAIMLEIKSENDPDPHYMPIDVTSWDDDAMTSYDPTSHATEVGITDLPIMFADDAEYRCTGLIFSNRVPKNFKFYLESCTIHTSGFYEGDIDVKIDLDPKGIDAKHLATTDQLPWKTEFTAAETLENLVR